MVQPAASNTGTPTPTLTAMVVPLVVLSACGSAAPAGVTPDLLVRTTVVGGASGGSETASVGAIEGPPIGA